MYYPTVTLCRYRAELSVSAIGTLELQLGILDNQRYNVVFVQNRLKSFQRLFPQCALDATA